MLLCGSPPAAIACCSVAARPHEKDEDWSEEADGQDEDRNRVALLAVEVE